MQSSRTPSSSTDTSTCVLVEDSSDDAYFFRRTLKKTGIGCELREFSDGSEVIRYLREARSAGGDSQMPHVIFLDLKMPVMSGFEVLGWIQRQAFNPPLYVIVLSGSDHAADVAKAHQLGASDYLVKPITVQDLKERLERAAHPASEAKPLGSDPAETARDA